MSDLGFQSDEIIALINLLAVDGIGSSTALRLIEKFGSALAVFDATEAELRVVPRFNLNVLTKLKAAKWDGDFGKRQIEEAEKRGISIVTFWDSGYPRKLREIENDAPALLYVRGKLDPNARRVAMVGTRSATAYGKRMAHDLVLGLRASGLHIVSGLASGIDSFCHEAALEAKLVTEAVFGCGVDRIYPPINTSLGNRILAEGGALISEFPIGTEPDRHHFPQRNRIIAGLCESTIVVEAGDRSGALITALLAVDYNREVMAVPGAVNNPKSRGCHSLIRSGAVLIERAEDILQTLSGLNSARTGEDSKTAPVVSQLPLDLAGSEAVLVGALDATEARHIDDLSLRLNLPVGEALGQLLLLELKGIVKQLPGKYFIRA